MVAVPFPKNSTPGARVGEGEGRRINAWLDKDGDKDIVRRCPGLGQIVATGGTGPRGALNADGVWYVVYNGSVQRVSGATVTTLTGTIPGSDGVTIAMNNKTSGGSYARDIVAVRSSGGAYVITASAVTAYPDADLPATANSVEFLGGYFHFTCPDGRLFASELNSTAINALSFTTAESRADGLRRVIASGSLLYAMGESTIEPYQNAGTQPYPMRLMTSVLPIGILATTAVVGVDEAWNNPIFFVASDSTVRALSGFETQRVSTPDVDRFIAASDRASIHMLAFVYRGNGYVAISSDKGTWEYDVTRSAWTERTSTGADSWRACHSFYDAARDGWVFCDRLSGDLLSLTPGVFTENGAAMEWMLESGPVKDFPARVAVPSLFCEFTKSDAWADIQWSHNGGQSWGFAAQRSMATADKWPIRVNRLGLTTHHGIRVRISSSAEQDFSFMGANIPVPDARKVG